MNKLANKIRAFWQDEEGLTTVEYAVAGTLVALTVVAAFTELGEAIAAAIRRIIAEITPE